MSESFASTSTTTEPSSSTVAVSSTVTGVSLTGLTVTVIVAVSVAPLPSLTVYDTVASPLKSALGEKVTWLSAVITALPCADEAAETESTSSSISESLARTATVTEASSSTTAVSSKAIGASFTPSTVKLMLAVAVPPFPSEIV